MTQNAPKQPISTYKLTKFSGEGLRGPLPTYTPSWPSPIRPLNQSVTW